MLLFIVVISLIGSLYHIIQVFKARMDNKINKSKIYFEDISNNDYESFKKDIQNMNSNELEEDIIGQIYVNSNICHMKYVHFSKARSCFVIFLLSYLLLYFLLWIGV
jgi:hypothetical protein